MLIGKRALNQGGCLFSSPVGNQVKLGPIYTVYRQLSIKWQKKQVLLVSLLLKNEMGEGRGGERDVCSRGRHF